MNTPPADPPSRPPALGGGCLIAAGLVLGPVLGLLFNQTSLGLILGAVIGVAAAVILTVLDKRR
ncbi:hypothetical protein GCM10011529_00740 [Polymorphobacter glacialis]|uniref:Glycine zipper family protein n=1 Tax=Sandarakinorhabdus glacialis TaxID=1614636 RepID=A0A917E370_9SPHN|nr:hypothetical protein [Polymorphobacter glacialis]GGD98556.1 hypothetical protein GCM10011529_00740 [Polymorphobacter glacialis]